MSSINQTEQAKKRMEEIIKTAKSIEDKIDGLDIEYINKNYRFFSKFFEYSDVCEDIVSFINSQTNYKYEPFKNISMNGILDSAKKLVYVSKLSDVFDYPFIKNIDSNWKFDKIEDSMISFIETNEASTIIEYKILKSLLGKIAILMCSDIERSFILDKPNINQDVKKYLETWTSKMEKFGTLKNNISKGWSVFINSLFNTKEVFRYQSKEQLHEILQTCYSSHFLMESLLGNILKTFQTNILIDYFHVIKSIFIWIRLVSILIQKHCHMERTELMNNIYLISCVVCSIYEDNFFISSVLPKSLPSNDNLSEETILYFINHTIKGPQYMILKQLENSGCCILNLK